MMQLSQYMRKKSTYQIKGNTRSLLTYRNALKPLLIQSLKEFQVLAHGQAGFLPLHREQSGHQTDRIST